MRGVPQGWVETALGQVASTQLGRMLSANRETGRHAKPYLRNRDVQWGAINTVDLPTMDFEGDDAKRFLLRYGDVLVCEGGEVGRAALWTDGVAECYFQKALHRVRVAPGVSNRFVRYLLEHYARTNSFAKFTTGSTIAHLPQEDLRLLPLNLPPTAEQERIVAAIEEAFSRLDAGVAALARVRLNLKRLRAAVLEAAVRGELLPGAPNEPALDVPASRGALSATLSQENRRKVDRAYSDLTERTWDIPSNWTWLPAADICQTIASGSTPSPAHMAPDNGEIPYVKVYNLTHTGSLNFTVRPTFIDLATHNGPLSRSRLMPGDILTNIVGPPLGKVSVVPSDYPEWNTNQAVVVFRPLSDVNPLLLKYWLLSPPVLALLESTSRATAGQFNVSLTTCRGLPLPIPPRATQDAIVDQIEEHLSEIEAAEVVVRNEISRAVSLRSAILAAAFSGQLVPQDPNDEPSIILLERIATERASPNGHKPTIRKPRAAQKKVHA